MINLNSGSYCLYFIKTTMSSEPVKCVTIYVDSYANTGMGKIVATCIVEKKMDNGLTHYKIVEPVSLKNRWSSSYYDFKVLPNHLADKYPVGFYTTGTHYKINRDAGFADRIKNKEYHEQLINNPNYDNRTHTWYSNGLQLLEGISDTQTHLYHM